jgi:hypothetical protein
VKSAEEGDMSKRGLNDEEQKTLELLVKKLGANLDDREQKALDRLLSAKVKATKKAEPEKVRGFPWENFRKLKDADAEALIVAEANLALYGGLTTPPIAGAKITLAQFKALDRAEQLRRVSDANVTRYGSRDAPVEDILEHFTKRCPKCDRTKNAKEGFRFHRYKGKVVAPQSWCKECNTNYGHPDRL